MGGFIHSDVIGFVSCLFTNNISCCEVKSSEMLSGKYLPTLRRTIVPPFSGSSVSI